MNKTIVFDADDTLWDEQGMLQSFERSIESKLNDILEVPTGFSRTFPATEDQNIPAIGYGLPSYMFSVAEAIAVNPAWHRQKNSLLPLVRKLINQFSDVAPRVFAGTKEALEKLTESNHSLVLLTRGQETEQRTKLSRSGLAGYFEHVHVVSRKVPATYRSLAHELGDPGGRTLCMVGNSVKADVNPAVTAGLHAIHVLAPNAWAHDDAELVMSARVRQVSSLSDVAELVDSPEFWLH
jgi:putative hydrolase of the HAD superfamily